MAENTISIKYFKSPYGELILGSFDHKLCLCDWRYRKMRAAIDERISQGIKAPFIEEGSNVLDKTREQLMEYFNRKRTIFDIPLLLIGSAFQQSIWNELCKIPYGKTETYLGLSQKINNEKAIRAVAAANGANAISILIPCHRVIGTHGELTGYAGGMEVKKKLLQLENARPASSQLWLFN